MKAVITVYDDNDNIIVKDKWLAPRCSEVDGCGAYAIIKDQFEFNVIREMNSIRTSYESTKANQ